MIVSITTKHLHGHQKTDRQVLSVVFPQTRVTQPLEVPGNWQQLKMATTGQLRATWVSVWPGAVFVSFSKSSDSIKKQGCSSKKISGFSGKLENLATMKSHFPPDNNWLELSSSHTLGCVFLPICHSLLSLLDLGPHLSHSCALPGPQRHLSV